MCPVCKETYARPPAVSREDNKTLICPSCGVREALLQIRMPKERIEDIVRQLKEFENEHT